ncbi:hypothetical protein HaloA020_15080 [Halomonas sp. A020]|jgi:hypothetical protein|nr:hypothetical protein [Halomonas sp. McD50-5]BCB60807.1 hypothetical protein HaloA020_15080 [Halomonas sp. A020]
MAQQFADFFLTPNGQCNKRGALSTDILSTNCHRHSLQAFFQRLDSHSAKIFGMLQDLPTAG